MEASRAGARLWVVLFAVAFGTNVPTPLLLLYRERLGLSATVLTAIFGVYAAGLLPALLLAGPASDRLGRRRVVVPFVVLSAVASCVFLPAAGSTPLLFLGRFLQGAVSGVVFSTGSAWMAELLDDPGRSARRTTAALSLGWSLGPLTSGLLATWAPAPTVLPYLLHLALLVVGCLALVGVPETATLRADAPLVGLGVPPGTGRAFGLFVLPVAFGVFAYASVSVTVLPLLLQGAMPGIDVAVTGVVAGVTLATGVLVQPLQRRLGVLRAGPVGLALGAVGLAGSLAANALHSWPLLIPVALVLGAAYGLCLAGGLAATERLADPAARGALTATFYMCAYAGFFVPLLVSLAARGGSLAGPLAALGGLSALLAGFVGLGAGRRHLERALRPAAQVA